MTSGPEVAAIAALLTANPPSIDDAKAIDLTGTIQATDDVLELI